MQAVVFGIALLLLVWLFGPLLAIRGVHPLDTVFSRAVATAVIFAAGAVGLVWARWQARAGTEALIDRLLGLGQERAPGADALSVPGPGAGESHGAAQADLAAVRQRFEAALGALRERSFGSAGLPAAASRGLTGALARLRARLQPRTLYELPWYVIIGAPGSGKTTALRHSGLAFPLANRLGQEAVRGVGGTRDCDWWFTEQAVLIDTAGRFTTQDSDTATDARTWAGFLDLLKRSRTWQPLNGVLVTVSVSDLLERNDTDRLVHAATVRRRLQELHEQLRVRLPIYLLVTKCDLLAGFMESFDSLGREQRASPWGFTFKLRSRSEPGSRVFDDFAGEFDTLQQRLAEGLIARLQAEPDALRRERIYGLPAQFAALRGVLQSFVETAFAPSPFLGEPMLRGVYFVSGTQEGTPIDRMLGAIARSYRLEHAIAPPHQASGKSFFLTRLLNDVVFAEQGLAGTDAQWERRRMTLTLGSYTAVAVLTVAALAAWGVSYSNNRQHVAAVAAAAQDLRRMVRELPEGTPAGDLRSVLPTLQRARALAQAEPAAAAVPWLMGFGLYQGHKLGSAARAAYERLLADALLPRVALAVEDRLRTGTARTAGHEVLKAYLMLHEPARLQAPTLQALLGHDWDERVAAGSLTPSEREALGTHLKALLALGGLATPVAADAALIAAARTRLAAVPLPQRVLDQLHGPASPAGAPADIAIDRLLGADSAKFFVRASGQPLAKGVPVLFTSNGYRQDFERDARAAAAALLAEQDWILGPQASAVPPADPAALVEAVRTLYLREYEARWGRFADDLRLAPATGLTAAEAQVRAIAAADGPLAILVNTLAQQALGAPPHAAAAAGAGPAVAALGALPAALPTALARLAEAHRSLAAAVQTAAGGGMPAANPALVAALKAEAASAPAPLRAVLDAVSAQVGRVGGLALRERLARSVRTDIGAFCSARLSGRYPIARGAALEAALDDFTAVFGPQGQFARLEPSLAPHVDTARWVFRAVPAGGAAASLGSDAGSLPQFERAQRIRAAFFDAGTAAVRLRFTPVALPGPPTLYTLEIDGQPLPSDAAPAASLNVAWPGPGGVSRVRLSARSGAEWVAEGPWALWRLADRARMRPGPAPGQWRLTFELEGAGLVAFDVAAASGLNPLNLDALTGFECPQGL